MERNCLNCHFLSKEHREENTGRVLTFSLSENDREILKKDPVGFDRGWYSFKCHMGVWDEGVSPVAAKEDKTIFSRKRYEECFFIEYRQSMLMPAAIELQKREENTRQLKSNQRLTIYGLYIASFGLILNAIVSLIRLIQC